MQKRAVKSTARFVGLLVHFDPEGSQEVDDPYYGGMSGFHSIVRCVFPFPVPRDVCHFCPFFPLSVSDPPVS